MLSSLNIVQSMDYNKIFNKINRELETLNNAGKLASYIPELSNINPNKYSITVWSPKLNEKGNSSKGMKFLEIFTSDTQSSIF